MPSGSYSVRVRLDPVGETNVLAVVLKTTIVSNAIKGSLKGGNMVFMGTGFPSTWPSKLTTLTITRDNIPL